MDSLEDSLARSSFPLLFTGSMTQYDPTINSQNVRVKCRVCVHVFAPLVVVAMNRYNSQPSYLTRTLLSIPECGEVNINKATNRVLADAMTPLSDANSSSLIVDFPDFQRRPSNGSTIHEMSVTFAPNCQGRYIKYSSARENALKWYTAEDQRRFRRQMMEDAVESSLRMADCFSHAPEELSFQDYVGLDHLISRDVSKRYEGIQLARKKHAKVVLAEHAAQRKRGRVSIEDLALVSSKSSRWSRERARKVGILVSMISWRAFRHCTIRWFNS